MTDDTMKEPKLMVLHLLKLSNIYVVPMVLAGCTAICNHGIQLELVIGGKTIEQWLTEIKGRKREPKNAQAQRPQSFRDAVVQARVHRDRDHFIATIRGEDLQYLFVEFQNGDRWVVRIPLAPTLAAPPADKLESEVAVMKLIAATTSIPVPEVHAYALGDGPEPFPSFLILEYVEGHQIDYAELKSLPDAQRTRLYASLAGIYIQLRRLVFPSVGRLSEGPVGPQITKRNTSIDLNMQELEGLEPSAIQDLYYSSGTLSSASRYVAMQLDLADNAFARGRGTVSDAKQGRDRLYHLHMFRQFTQGWLNDKFDHGPFVLAHGDLEIFNLVLDHDLNIVSVLDWEWSRVVPVQLFRPPLWLDSTTIENLCHGARYRRYLERFDSFLDVLRARERERYGNELLANEWNKQKQKSGFMVAYALENWTAMDWFANRYINL
ncbi:phosphotransferase enzyme family protein [Chaetomium tenue]|uniref:Phosphotransferase enzyme family protein n=1 Tax=Chaetomium tenue TaxID=1854479 RepID=A0ACB7NWW7_9PEZI|nr:phosphotransferase enzyme family protein [Chaetomium globosum]